MSLSALVLEKSRANKKCDEEEEEGHVFGLFAHRCKMAVTWLYATLLILYVHSIEESTLMSIFD